MMRILGITAHPDDEVGAFGGTLLLYRSRGVETFVICLTPGRLLPTAAKPGRMRNSPHSAAPSLQPRAGYYKSSKLKYLTIRMGAQPGGFLCGGWRPDSPRAGVKAAPHFDYGARGSGHRSFRSLDGRDICDHGIPLARETTATRNSWRPDCNRIAQGSYIILQRPLCCRIASRFHHLRARRPSISPPLSSARYRPSERTPREAP